MVVSCPKGGKGFFLLSKRGWGQPGDPNLWRGCTMPASMSHVMCCMSLPLCPPVFHSCLERQCKAKMNFVFPPSSVLHIWTMDTENEHSLAITVQRTGRDASLSQILQKTSKIDTFWTDSYRQVQAVAKTVMFWKHKKSLLLHPKPVPDCISFCKAIHTQTTTPKTFGWQDGNFVTLECMRTKLEYFRVSELSTTLESLSYLKLEFSWFNFTCLTQISISAPNWTQSR